MVKINRDNNVLYVYFFDVDDILFIKYKNLIYVY